MPQHAGRPGRLWNDHRTRLEGSSGGSGWGRRGVICPRRSGRISLCGKNIGCGPRTGRMRGCSMRCVSRPVSTRTTWSRSCRSIRRWCVPTSTLLVRARTRWSVTPRRTQGAASSYKNSRVVPAEPPDHALRRSRGDLTTKLHALADPTCTPVLALLTTGQAGEPDAGPAAEGTGRDRSRHGLLADKAYSHSSTRTFLRDKRIKHTAPERSDQIAYRKTKGSKGARRVRRPKVQASQDRRAVFQPVQAGA